MSEIEQRLLREMNVLERETVPDLTEALLESGLVDVAYAEFDSALGRLLLAATGRGLVRVSYLTDDESRDLVLERLAERVSPRVVAAPKRLDPARRQLDEYFAGKRREFELELDWTGIEGFRRRVLEATRRIPFGQTLSYTGVATEAGSPRAYRAAGNALGSNPLAIVVPCHRILHSGGGLGGYTGGLHHKRALLRIEDVLPDSE